MDFTALLQATFREPRITFRKVAALNLPAVALWQALTLTVVVSVILTSVAIAVDPTDLPIGLEFMSEPLVNAVLQALFLAFFTFILNALLRMAGGTNRMNDVVLAVAWVQAVLCLLSLAQLVVLLVSPLLAALVGLASFVIFLWLMIAFITEASGFSSSGRAVLVIAAALIISGLIAGILLLATGIVDAKEFTNA
jgi:hypothetical protein